jgi:hypothetical protein
LGTQNRKQKTEEPFAKFSRDTDISRQITKLQVLYCGIAALGCSWKGAGEGAYSTFFKEIREVNRL